MSIDMDSIVRRARLKAVSKRVIKGGTVGEELAKMAGVIPVEIEEGGDSSSGQLYFVQGLHGSNDDVIIP